MYYKSLYRFGFFIILLFLIQTIFINAVYNTEVDKHFYGTIWDESYPDSGVPVDINYLDKQYGIGIRLKNVYIRWNLYEQSGNNNWNIDYINQKKEEIKILRKKGFSIILRVNPFPVPEWYFRDYQNSRFKNQFGTEWQPEIDGNNQDERDTSAVSFWHPQYKLEFDEYVQHVFSELGNNFFAVYLTIGKWGEVAYPEMYYNGDVNCYWAWDDYARQDIESKYPQALDFIPGQGPADGERVLNGGFEDYTVNGLEAYYLNHDTIANWESSLECKDANVWEPQIIEDPNQAYDGIRYLKY